MKCAFPLSVAVVLAAAPFAASAQQPGAQWTGDVCHQGAPAPTPARAPSSLFESHPKVVDATGARPIACLPYPPRIKVHATGCQWVSDFYGGVAHEFEACRDGDGLWRPSGRS